MVVDDSWYMTGRTSRVRDPGYYRPSYAPSMDPWGLRYREPTRTPAAGPQVSTPVAGLGDSGTMTIGPATSINRSMGNAPFRPGDRFIESETAPNDAELSRLYGYMPVHSGWLHVSGPEKTDLGDPSSYVAQFGSDEDVKEMVANQRLQVRMQMVTTVSLTILASLGVIQAIREIRKYRASKSSF